jgi:hypothetical protein
MTVSQPYVALYSVPTSTTTLSPNTAFYAQVGLSDVYYGGVSAQAVRAGGTTLTVSIASSQVGVGQLQQTAGTSGTASVTIPVGQYYSPTTVAGGGVAFDPVGAGTTTITATVPGFLQRPTANQAVTVSSPGITMYSVTVGSGLMVSNSLFLGASETGGVTVWIRSSSPAIAKVSANATTAGTDSVGIFVPNGQTGVTFFVHGIEGQTGTVTFTASAPGFVDGSAPITVVQPAVQFYWLYGTTYSASAADQLFYLWVGTPYGSPASGVSTQAVRAGAAPLVATVTSATPAVGTLVNSAGSGATRTVNIAAGSYQTAGTVGGGGIAFDPLTTGSTSVSVSIPGYVQTTAATQTITVTP